MREGQLEQGGGRWRVRFTRRLGHPPEKVWRALTEPAHLATWFPTTIEGDRADGGPRRTQPSAKARPAGTRLGLTAYNGGRSITAHAVPRSRARCLSRTRRLRR